MILPIESLAKENKEQKFWKWFIKKETTIFEFEKNQEIIFNLINSKLNSYKSDITFEISHAEDGKRKFIISADGIVDLFPYVKSLVQNAPELKLFSIVAFRPRLDDYENFKLKYRDIENNTPENESQLLV